MRPITKQLINKSLPTALLALALASPGNAAPKSGDRFGDWIYECSANSKEKFCVLTQTAVTTRENTRVMKLTLGRYGAKKELALVALVPLGIYLPAGVVGRVDDAKPFVMTVRTCTTQGCEAALKIDPKLRWRIRSGKKLFIGFKASPQAKTVALPFSLTKVWFGLQAIGER
jgi:invasion protein IalB